MKKGVKWLTVLSFILFVLTWSVMRLKLLEHDYDITAEAYLGLGFLLIFSSASCIASLRIDARIAESQSNPSAGRSADRPCKTQMIEQVQLHESCLLVTTCEQQAAFL